MKWRQTAILLVVFAALGIFAWTLREAQPTQIGPQAPTATPGPIVDLDAASVSTVRVEGEGNSYELTRVSGVDWQIDGRPAASTVDGVVTQVAELAAQRTLPDDRNPRDYGFATPWMTITLSYTDTEQVLFVGDEVPTNSSQRYLRVGSDGPIHAVDAFDLGRLNEWLTTPPDAPTATPEPSATPDGWDGEEEDEALDMYDDEAAEDEVSDDGSETDDDSDDAEDADSEDEPESDEVPEAQSEGTPTASATPPHTATPTRTATPEAADGDDG